MIKLRRKQLVSANLNMRNLLRTTINQGASDLHLVVGSPPSLRLHGAIVRLKSEPLNAEQTRQLCYSVLTDAQKGEFEQNRDLDFSFAVAEKARFRGNIFSQQGCVSGVFRCLPIDIPYIGDLGLPEGVGDVTDYPNGLVLVTGATGSGKSTTIASLINEINKCHPSHIVTLEDPIEYTFRHEKSIVNQREVGKDTKSFSTGLKYVLRQDPDVCFLGEMRDRETMETALTLAETGHLVFATLHTNSAESTISRILSAFPGEEKEQIQMQLSTVLRAILSQTLVTTTASSSGTVTTAPTGRVLACEALILNTSIRHLIREGKYHQIYGMMQVGQKHTGNITMNQSLFSLSVSRKISMEKAFEHSGHPEELDQMFKKVGI